MNRQQLDAFLRKVTPREQYYLDHPGARSPIYQTTKQEILHGRPAYVFQLPDLPQDEIHVRKDSRFTDVPYYVHSNVNINYIYSGHCDYLIDDLPVTLYQGDVAIFDLDVVRRKKHLGENDIVINLNLTHAFFNDSFLRKAGEQNIFSEFMLRVLSTRSPTHDHYMIFRTQDEPDIRNLFTSLLCEYFSDLPYRKPLIQGYFHLIFLYLLRLHQQHSDGQMVQIVSIHNRKVVDILYYIESHYASCTLKDLSDHFGYHPKYISSMLRKMTGFSFKQIQIRERMKEAGRLLTETDKSVQEIALQIGMANLSSFYRTFKEHYGMLPDAYRRHARPISG